jgi:hypothetical protein
MTKTGQLALSSGQFPGAANRPPFCKLLLNNMKLPALYNMIGFPAYQTGLSVAHLHIEVHGFAFFKDAKPDDEHNLTSFSNPTQACSTA